MQAWQSSTPNQKTELVTELSQTLLGVSKGEAQSLPLKDVPSPSLYEKAFSLLHHQKRRMERLSSRLSGSSSRSTSDAAGVVNSEA